MHTLSSLPGSGERSVMQLTIIVVVAEVVFVHLSLMDLWYFNSEVHICIISQNKLDFIFGICICVLKSTPQSLRGTRWQKATGETPPASKATSCIGGVDLGGSNSFWDSYTNDLWALSFGQFLHFRSINVDCPSNYSNKTCDFFSDHGSLHQL